MRAVVIPVDEPPWEAALPGGAARFVRSLRDLIGTACAERIQITSRWEAWLDEDGSAAGKPVNEVATLIARAYGAEYAFIGTVVITGTDGTGEPAGLSAAQAGIILGKIRAPST